VEKCALLTNVIFNINQYNIKLQRLTSTLSLSIEKKQNYKLWLRSRILKLTQVSYALLYISLLYVLIHIVFVNTF
jgi:ABC-type enterochelin transport system permease subunit